MRLETLTTEFKWKASFTVLNAAVDAPISHDGIEIRTHPQSSKDSPKLSVTYFATSNSAPSVNGQIKDNLERFLDVEICNDALLGLDVREGSQSESERSAADAICRVIDARCLPGFQWRSFSSHFLMSSLAVVLRLDLAPNAVRGHSQELYHQVGLGHG
jgi:hypothetical protein